MLYFAYGSNLHLEQMKNIINKFYQKWRLPVRSLSDARERSCRYTGKVDKK